MRLTIKANLVAAPRKPKWSPDIKHKTETKVIIPDVLLKGTYQDLIAEVTLDPVSQGYDAVVDVMGHKVKAWGMKIKEAQNELIRKVQDLVKDMQWDVSPIQTSNPEAIVLRLSRKAAKYNNSAKGAKALLVDKFGYKDEDVYVVRDHLQEWIAYVIQPTEVLAYLVSTKGSGGAKLVNTSSVLNYAPKEVRKHLGL